MMTMMTSMAEEEEDTYNETTEVSLISIDMIDEATNEDDDEDVETMMMYSNDTCITATSHNGGDYGDDDEYEEGNQNAYPNHLPTSHDTATTIASSDDEVDVLDDDDESQHVTNSESIEDDEGMDTGDVIFSARENKALSSIRLQILLVQTIVSLLITYTVYRVQTNTQQQLYQQTFQDRSHAVIRKFQQYIPNVVVPAMDNYVMDIQQTYPTNHPISIHPPFITISEFERRSHNFIQLTNADRLVFSQVILLNHTTNSSRIDNQTTAVDEWINYTTQHYKDWIHVDMEMVSEKDIRLSGVDIDNKKDSFIQPTQSKRLFFGQSSLTAPSIASTSVSRRRKIQEKPDSLSLVSPSYFHPYIYNITKPYDDEIDISTVRMVLPLWQTYPYQTIYNESVVSWINADMFTIPELTNVLSTTVSNARNQITVGPYIQQLDNRMRMTHPTETKKDTNKKEEKFCTLHYPIVVANNVVAIFTSIWSWKSLFTNDALLTVSSKGLMIVIASFCGSDEDNTFLTYQIVDDNNTVEFIGNGDLHLKQYETISASSSSQSSEESMTPLGGCNYTMHVYPSKDMYNEYITNRPIIYAFIVACMFVLGYVLFFTYDWLVERRQKIVMDHAVRSNDILASLFPENVRSRLFGGVNGTNTDDLRAISNHHTTTVFQDSDDHISIDVEDFVESDEDNDDGRGIPTTNDYSIDVGSETTSINYEYNQPTITEARAPVLATPRRTCSTGECDNGSRRNSFTSLLTRQFSSGILGKKKMSHNNRNSNNNNNSATPRSDSVIGDTGNIRKHTRFSSSPAYQNNKKPIADLFPRCTVLFADISGFTAWSSLRDPCQVFMLLEGVYHAFDKIARRRGVFKVETIGDCYVAVTGCPETQDDHAFIMAKFARDCRIKFKEVTKELELSLGPDTADLLMRFGLHSGPVTAGVLRGEKSRFQLFGDTVNTAARMESNGMRDMIQISQSTADLLNEGGKGHWVRPREELVNAKGKGSMQTYWLEPNSKSAHARSSMSSLSTSDETRSLLRHGEPLSATPDSSSSTPPIKRKDCIGLDNKCLIWGADADLDGNDLIYRDRHQRLINYNVDLLASMLKKIVARRTALSRGRRASITNAASRAKSMNDAFDEHSTSLLDEVKEFIRLPNFDAKACEQIMDLDSIHLSEDVLLQLKKFVTSIASLYRGNPFHNFEHSSHVTMSINKLLQRVATPSRTSEISALASPISPRRRSLLMTLPKVNTDEGESLPASPQQIASDLHNYTYGITSDPLTQFAIIFGALIHDCDHWGVSNGQLVKENEPIAERYNNKSILEQNSFELAWSLFMDDYEYGALQECLFPTEGEYQRFRQVVVNVVMATDIFDGELNELRNQRWKKAFDNDKTNGTDIDVENRKATVVIEHIMQASDVAHTMQHWHVYQKWNRRLFDEMYTAFRAGRMEADPSKWWYKGELKFFNEYVIPLAKKLKDCNVFGVASDECLTYAENNKNEWEGKGEQIVAELVANFLQREAEEIQFTQQRMGGQPKRRFARRRSLMTTGG